MRKVAISKKPDAAFRRAMIYDSENGEGVMLFLFRSLDDGPCDADYWHPDLALAENHAAIDLAVGLADWQPIADPQPGCLVDWIAPVRMARDRYGRMKPGVFEPLRQPGEPRD
jgi:hypothetical protein